MIARVTIHIDGLNEYQKEELKKYVGHHLEYLLQLDSFPEIMSIGNGNMQKTKDADESCQTIAFDVEIYPHFFDELHSIVENNINYLVDMSMFTQENFIHNCTLTKVSD